MDTVPHGESIATLALLRITEQFGDQLRDLTRLIQSSQATWVPDLPAQPVDGLPPASMTFAVGTIAVYRVYVTAEQLVGPEGSRRWACAYPT